MSLFSSLKPKANLSRNVFDRSRTDSFSMKLGALTPCFVEHTVPDGKYKIDVSDICRVDSQVTANFVGMNQVVDFFFVPYSQIWKGFNKFYYGKGEETRMNTNLVNNDQPVFTPTFDLESVITNIFEACFNYELYKRFTNITLSAGGLIPANFITWAEGVDIIMNANVPNPKYCDIHGRFCGYDQLRNLDMLGYGNYLPLLKFAMADLVEMTDTDLASNLAGPIASSSDTTAWDTYLQTQMSKVLLSLPSTYATSFPLQAYCKIFNDIYMNRIYPENHLERFYNIDYFKGLTVGALATDYAIYCLRPWYRQYKKDMFTGLYPNPQFGNVAVAGFDLNVGVNSNNYVALVNRSGSGANQSVVTDSDAYLSAGSGRNSWKLEDLQASSNPLITVSGDTAISALSIRQALAFQKYKEKLLRAGQRESDLQQAIFGVGSRYIEDKYVDFLGSFQSAIQINPVAATSDLQLGSTDQHLGELGAYAVGSIGMGEGKTVEFDAKDFGMIIGIAYIMPETKYEATGIDPHNVKFEPDDYFNPSMQNLGLHPVNSYFALATGLNGQVESWFTLGYLAEYFEYKTAVSKVHGEFYGSNAAIPLNYDDIPNYDAQMYQNVQLTSRGAFSMFVAPRDVRDVAAGTKEMLYIAPWDADRIFNVAEGVEQALDHFKLEMTFRVKAVLPMSVVGLPS